MFSYRNYISIPDPFKSEMRSRGRIVEGVWFPARPGDLANSTAPATGKEFDALSVMRRQGDNTGVEALGDFDEVIPDRILNRGKLKSGSSRSAGTQPAKLFQGVAKLAGRCSEDAALIGSVTIQV
jgi:hypothetical protein